MRTLLFSELCNKEVISCCDCTRLGYISDCTINTDTATIISVTVEKHGGITSLFRKKTSIIPWECITRIGDDLIIAEYAIPPSAPVEKQGFLRGLLGK